MRGIVEMEQKDLKKLSRSELLEMLLDRSKEIEHLRRELKDANSRIIDLEREIEVAGHIEQSIKNLEESTEVIHKFAAIIKYATDKSNNNS